MLLLLPAAAFSLTGISFKRYDFRDANRFLEIANVINQADLVLDYTNDKKFKTGETRKIENKFPLFPEQNYVYEEITYSLDELKSFLDNQDKKDLVIIILDKSKSEMDYGLQDELMTLHNYLASAGYKRIMILQGVSQGVVVFWDEVNKEYEK